MDNQEQKPFRESSTNVKENLALLQTESNTQQSLLTTHQTVFGILFSLFFIAAIFLLFYIPWYFYPLRNLSNFLPSSTVLPSWNTIQDNIRWLFQGSGTYAKFLWGWIVFLSMSSLFFVVGKLIFKTIFRLNFKKISFDEMPQINLSKLELVACQWLLGSWGCAMIWFFVGICGFFKQSIAQFLLIMGLFAGAVYLYKQLRYFCEQLKKVDIYQKLSSIRFDFATVLILISVFWVLLWSFICIYPVYYWDTLLTDLALPSYYIAEGKLVFNPFHIYSYHHQNNALLTVWALLLNSQEASFLIVWGYYIAIIIFMIGWLSRVSSKVVAACAIALFVSSDLGFWLGRFIKNDMQVGLFLVLQWWALMIAFGQYGSENQKQLKRWLFLVGLFSGISWGFKFTAMPSIVITFFGSFLFFLFKGPGGIKNSDS